MNTPSRTDLDELGQRGEVVLDVDDAGRVVAEHPEQPVEAHIDGRRLHQTVVEGLDDDASGSDLLTDRAVRQDHGRTIATGCQPLPCGPLADVVQWQNISFPS